MNGHQQSLFDIGLSSPIPTRSPTHWEWESDKDNSLFANDRKPPSSRVSEYPIKEVDVTHTSTRPCVNEYQPGGTASKGNKYFRFSYRDGKRIKHIHIKGGNIASSIARTRKELIEGMTNRNVPLERIINTVKSF